MTEQPADRSRWSSEAKTTGSDYDKAWDRLVEAGENPHGEADLVESLGPATILDAGCGTGRVAIELAARGKSVVGVDLDPRMLAEARAKAPHLEWHQADLSTLSLEDDGGRIRLFEAIVMAGNVMIFLAPGSEADVLGRLAMHLAPGGCLVAGFQLQEGRLGLSRYDDLAAAAGLEFVGRYSTWSREPLVEPGDYAVTVHRRGGKGREPH